MNLIFQLTLQYNSIKQEHEYRQKRTISAVNVNWGDCVACWLSYYSYYSPPPSKEIENKAKCLLIVSAASGGGTLQVKVQAKICINYY